MPARKQISEVAVTKKKTNLPSVLGGMSVMRMKIKMDPMDFGLLWLFVCLFFVRVG